MQIAGAEKAAQAIVGNAIKSGQSEVAAVRKVFNEIKAGEATKTAVVEAGNLRRFQSSISSIGKEFTARSAATKATVTGELGMAQQLSAVASLQRQRSAALVSNWKQQEKAARDAAQGVVPLRQGLAGLTETMRTLGASVGVLQGPLNGISGRLTSLGTLARSVAGETQEVGSAAVIAGTGVTRMATATGGGTAAMSGLLASMGPVSIVALVVAEKLAIAAIAAGVFAKGAFALGEEFFGLAKAAAGFRGELFDLSQQTGVSVETLNALAITASKTGGSIESIAQSLVIFQGHLEDAQNDVSDMGKKFAELGISTNDTETAFRDAIKSLAAMEEGFHQTNEAAELFGRRGGKQVLAILKETNGDIDSAVTKLGNLAGVTTEEARAADEFNDSLRDLHILLRNAIGKEAIPAATKGLQELERFIKENEGAIEALGAAIHVVGLAFEGWILSITTGLGVIRDLGAVTAALLPDLGRLADLWVRIGKKGGFVTPIEGATGGASGSSRFGGITGGAEGVAPSRTGGGGQDPANVARRLAAITLSDTIKGYDAESQALDRKLKRDLISETAYTTSLFALNRQRYDATIAGLEAEESEAKKIRKKGQREIALKEIHSRMLDADRDYAEKDQKILDANQDYNLEQTKLIGEARVTLAKTVAEGILRVHEITNEQHKARFADLAQFQLVTETSAAEKSKQDELKLFDERDALLDTAYDEREKKMDRDLANKLRGSNEYIQIEQAALNDLREINFQRGALEAERSAFVEDADRRIAQARIQDVQNLQRYHDELAGIYSDISDAAQEAAEATISPLRDNVFARNEVIDFDERMGHLRESERAKEAIRRLADQRELNELARHHAELVSLDLSLTEQQRQTARNRADQLLQINQGLNKEIEAQLELSEAKQNEITARAADERKQQMREIADDLAQITSDIFDNLGKGMDEFWKGVADSATNNLKRIGDEILKGFFEKLIVGDTKGSQAGGITGAVANKVLGIFGVKPIGVSPEVALADNTKSTDDNTAEIKRLTIAMGGIPGLGGGGGTASLISSLLGGLFGGGGKGDLPFGGSGGGVEGKALASGMDYVPYDGFKAILHRGERVVPAIQNRSIGSDYRPNISPQIMNLNEAGGIFGNTGATERQRDLRLILLDDERKAKDHQANSDENLMIKLKRNRYAIKTLLAT